jgi:hypothetical protein
LGKSLRQPYVKAGSVDAQILERKIQTLKAKVAKLEVEIQNLETVGSPQTPQEQPIIPQEDGFSATDDLVDEIISDEVTGSELARTIVGDEGLATEIAAELAPVSTTGIPSEGVENESQSGKYSFVRLVIEYRLQKKGEEYAISRGYASLQEYIDSSVSMVEADPTLVKAIAMWLDERPNFINTVKVIARVKSI